MKCCTAGPICPEENTPEQARASAEHAAIEKSKDRAQKKLEKRRQYAGFALWMSLLTEALNAGVGDIHIMPPREKGKILFGLDELKEIDVEEARAIASYLTSQPREFAINIAGRTVNLKVTALSPSDLAEQQFGDRVYVRVMHGRMLVIRP